MITALDIFKTLPDLALQPFVGAQDVPSRFATYEDYLLSKQISASPVGFDVDLSDINPMLFDWQARGLQWLLKIGKGLAGWKMGLGKAQPLDAKILTPTGWTTMGQLKVGDCVVGSDGKPTRVMGVYPQGHKEIYRVTFSDGSYTECCNEHLWQVNSPGRNFTNLPPKVLTLSQIMDAGLKHENGNRQHFIPVTRPVEFYSLESLPIHPYVLGVLIGDGGLTGSTPRLSTEDESIVDDVKSLLPDGILIKKLRTGCDYSLSDSESNSRWAQNRLTTSLVNLGLWGKKSEHKFIPDLYKFSSIDNRVALLQGLMDTDGWVNRGKRGNATQFCTTSHELAQDIVFVVQSLGGIARTKFKSNSNLGAYIVTLSLPNEVAPFRLKRKLDLVKPRTKYAPSRSIEDVELVGVKEAQCIMVDSPDNLYLTDNCIVTHKTFLQVEFARLVHEHTKERVLIVCPLAVAKQTIREAQKLGVDIEQVRTMDDVKLADSPITIVNLDMFRNKFTPDLWKKGALIIDESSILASYQGETKKFIIPFMNQVRYGLCCSGTFTRNDYMEIGNHAEALGVMPSNQMLANWFMTGGKVESGEIAAGKYRLRPLGEEDFWRWVTTWGLVVNLPSDIGGSDDGYIMPPLDIRFHYLNVDHTRAWGMTDKKGQAYLFLPDNPSSTEMWKEKQMTYQDRVYKAIELVETEPNEYQILWCDLNRESAVLTRELAAKYPSDVVEVKGDDSIAEKEAKLDAFSTGLARIIVTKSKIAGLGLNWQHCARQKMVSVNYSWEKFAQMIARTNRFGNPRQTIIDMIATETEQGIVKAIKRKDHQDKNMHEQIKAIYKKYGLWRSDRRTLTTNLGNMEMELPQWLTR